jgi:hypothetical protein
MGPPSLLEKEIEILLQGISTARLNDLLQEYLESRQTADQALYLLQFMVAHCRKPSPDSLTDVLRMYRRNGNGYKADQAMNLKFELFRNESRSVTTNGGNLVQPCWGPSKGRFELTAACTNPFEPTLDDIKHLLGAWSKSCHPDAPQRCNMIIETVYKLWKFGLWTLKPDSSLFSQELAAWASSDHPHASAFCQIVLDKMKNLSLQHDDEDMSPQPTTYTFAIIACLAKGDMARASILIKEHLRAFQVEPRITQSLHPLLNLWIKSADPNAAAKVERTVRNWTTLAKLNILSDRPSHQSFQLALKGWYVRKMFERRQPYNTSHIAFVRFSGLSQIESTASAKSSTSSTG